LEGTDVWIYAAIDWAATGAMLSGWATLIGAFAVIYAAHKGSDTFKQWRRQKSEERRIELAEQVLTLAYKLRRAIEGIRSPAMFEPESSVVYEELRRNGVIDDNTPAGHRGILATAQATLSRTNNNKPLWDSLLDTMPSAKAIFGDEVETALNLIWTQRNRIIVAAQRYARTIHDRNAPTEDAMERQIMRNERTEAIIWAGAGENGEDEIAGIIDTSIQTLENALLPVIRADTSFGTAISAKSPDVPKIERQG
jgi:hypothetical protein